jgi:hypothetical protein
MGTVLVAECDSRINHSDFYSNDGYRIKNSSNDVYGIKFSNSGNLIGSIRTAAAAECKTILMNAAE